MPFHPSEFVTFKTSSHLPGIELYSARLVKHAFAPHVHDGYSIGAIETGVERFRYAGTEHVAPAGTLVMLNPDELHTGQAEVEAGWTYQMLYIEPDTLRAMTGSEAFFPDASAHHPQLAAAYCQAFSRLWHAPDDVAFICNLTRLIDAIVLRYGKNVRATQPISAQQARRAARAKSLLAQRTIPSEAAAACGLTDQSHLNRWFKRAYGVTPAQYQQQIGTRPITGNGR